jgi:hypothetical protein
MKIWPGVCLSPMGFSFYFKLLSYFFLPVLAFLPFPEVVETEASSPLP